MSIKNHGEKGTLLLPSEAAWVWNEEKGFSLLLPDYKKDEKVPNPVILMTAVMVKAINNEKWAIEILKEWMQNSEDED